MRRRLFTAIGLSLFIAILPAALFAGDENLPEIQKAIQEKGLHWQAGPAFFSDADFRARLGMALSPRLESLAAPPIEPGVDLPGHFDWRDRGAVTAVKDQQHCGGCWAFAIVGALESAAIRQGDYPQTIDLSEQYVLSCWGQWTCNGAYNLSDPIEYLVRAGTVDAACFPYQGHDAECSLCADHQQRWYAGGDYGSAPPDAARLAQAIRQKGPLAVTMEVWEDFQHYTGGVYSYAWGKDLGGHAVLLVGYDDLGRHFIAKNSWGAAWGESGFFRISYDAVNDGRIDLGHDAEWIAFGTGPNSPKGGDDDNDSDGNRYPYPQGDDDSSGSGAGHHAGGKPVEATSGCGA